MDDNLPHPLYPYGTTPAYAMVTLTRQTCLVEEEEADALQVPHVDLAGALQPWDAPGVADHSYPPTQAIQEVGLELGQAFGQEVEVDHRGLLQDGGGFGKEVALDDPEARGERGAALGHALVELGDQVRLDLDAWWGWVGKAVREDVSNGRGR